MTLTMYARRKRWPLEYVTVTLHHSKIHAADCEACETREGWLDHTDSGVVQNQKQLIDRAEAAFIIRLSVRILLRTRN